MKQDNINTSMKPRGEIIMNTVVSVIALISSSYHIYTALFGIPIALHHRIMHITMMLLLVFFLYGFKEKRKGIKLDFWTVLYFLLIIGFCIYMFVNTNVFLTRFAYVERLTNMQMIVGTLITILILEGTRRSIGPQLPIVAFIFIIYALFGNYLPKGSMLWHEGISYGKMLDVLYAGLDGMWGEPVAASSTYVFLFTLFASFLISTGTGEFFSDFAISATRKSKGGAAKTAIISSALMGTISGASTANVVATGSFTIPLMKKTGYEKDFAGAVEAVASTGGQIMPPVMGVAAFIMVEITGIPYKELIMRAALPAILYFLAVYLMVHFHACKHNLQGTGDLLPDVDFKVLLKRKWHLFMPVVVILACMIYGFTPQRASVFGILSTILVSCFLKETRPTIKKIMNALIDGSKMVAPIACACAGAGIIMGMVMITGLGFKMVRLVVEVSGGNLLIALFLSMFAAIILGMGVPTSAAYIIMATMLAPALINMGTPVIIAHLFLFYFACVSSITPPVALAAYAAAGISGGDPVKTGFIAMRLGVMSFVVPFMFVYIPGILMFGSLTDIIRAVVTSIAGVYFLSSGLEGWLFSRLSLLWRGIVFISAVFLLTDSMVMIAIGTVIGITTIIFNKREANKLAI